MFSFDTPTNLIYGAVTGLVFGFLLQRAMLTRYQVIVGQLLFRDNTMLKTMLTAVVVGSAGLYFMLAHPEIFGEVKLHVKPAVLVSNIVGGIIFGIGMAILGYCPGTAVGAIGDGSKHAWAGIVGMLFGAAVYAELYPVLGKPLENACNLGKVTLPEFTGTSPTIWIAALAVVAIVVLATVEMLERRMHPPTVSSPQQRAQ